MRKLSRWVKALVVACACVTALLFAFMPFIPLDQGNSEPFQDVGKSMLTEANEQADTASGSTTAASDQQSGSEAADENATGYEQGAVLVKLDDNMTVEQSRDLIIKETGLKDVGVESLTDSIAKVTFDKQINVKDAVKAIMA